jgi:hypothetical protein
MNLKVFWRVWLQLHRITILRKINTSPRMSTAPLRKKYYHKATQKQTPTTEPMLEMQTRENLNFYES